MWAMVMMMLRQEAIHEDALVIACPLLVEEGVRSMQITKQPQNLGFEFIITFTASKRRLQKLAPEGIKPEALFQKPPKLFLGQYHALTLQVGC